MGLTNPPLSVTVASNQTVNWYIATNSDVMKPLLANSLTFVPTNTTTTNGSWTYWAQNMGPFPTGTTCPTNERAPVKFTLEPCTNQLWITPDTSTNALVWWYGNYVLQSKTNLLGSNSWKSVTTGVGGQTNSIPVLLSQPPMDFFRLYGPTN